MPPNFEPKFGFSPNGPLIFWDCVLTECPSLWKCEPYTCIHLTLECPPTPRDWFITMNDTSDISHKFWCETAVLHENQYLVINRHYTSWLEIDDWNTPIWVFLNNLQIKKKRNRSQRGIWRVIVIFFYLKSKTHSPNFFLMILNLDSKYFKK